MNRAKAEQIFQRLLEKGRKRLSHRRITSGGKVYILRRGANQPVERRAA